MGESANRPGLEAMTFQNGDVRLSGTFVDVADTQAAALILSGSGRLDRDSNTPKLKLRVSEAIANAFRDEQVASLRYDKRGVGESDGDYLSVGMTDNYSDAVAALEWLSTRCPDTLIFVVGHSEGSLHAAHLAADEKTDGAILVASPAQSGDKTLIWQAEQITPTLPKATRALLKLIHVDPLKSQLKQFERIRSSSAYVVRVQGKKLNARWFREFLDYDPAPILRRIKVPVLALTGGHDIQVPPEDVYAIKEQVEGPCESHIVGDLSHLLRSDPETKGPRDYRQAVRRPVDPELLGTITKWTRDHLPS
jgi:pimeloyl-ACP methyl ester carboxylesterase